MSSLNATSCTYVLFGAVTAYFLYKKLFGSRRRKRAASVGQTGPMIIGAYPETYGCPNHIINVVLTLQGVPNVAEIKKDFTEHCLPYLRFNSVPSVPNRRKFTNHVWTPTEVKIDGHFYERTLDAKENVQDVITELINTNLKDKGKPWWECHFFIDKAANKTTCVWRLEHALGDGISLMQVMCKLGRNEAGEVLNVDELFNPKGRGKGSSSKSLVSSLFMMLLLPFKILGGFWTSVVTPLIGKDVSTPMRDLTLYKSGWSRRVCTIFDTVSLDYIKDIKNKLGGGYTVNDVMYGAYAGMWRRFMEDSGVKNIDKTYVRTLTPIAFPVPVSAAQKLSHTMRVYWVFASTYLPLNAPSVIGRVKAANMAFGALKTSLGPFVLAKFQVFLGKVLPLSFVRNSAFDLIMGHSAVFSNVPGPQMKVTMGGAALDSIHMVFANIIPQVGIVSMNGKVCFALTTAEFAKASDPEKLKKFYLDELLEIGSTLGVDTSKMLVK